MKKYLTFISLIFIVSVNAQTSDEVVQQFFQALSAKDVKTLDHLTLDNMQLHSIALNDSVVINTYSKEMFIQNIKSISENVSIEERIFDLTSLKSDYLSQYNIPYAFFINGELSHTGINVLTMLKTEEGWRISYIADTRNKEN